MKKTRFERRPGTGEEFFHYGCDITPPPRKSETDINGLYFYPVQPRAVLLPDVLLYYYYCYGARLSHFKGFRSFMLLDLFYLENPLTLIYILYIIAAHQPEKSKFTIYSSTIQYSGEKNEHKWNNNNDTKMFVNHKLFSGIRAIVFGKSFFWIVFHHKAYNCCNNNITTTHKIRRNEIKCIGKIRVIYCRQKKNITSLIIITFIWLTRIVVEEGGGWLKLRKFTVYIKQSLLLYSIHMKCVCIVIIIFNEFVANV